MGVRTGLVVSSALGEVAFYTPAETKQSDTVYCCLRESLIGLCNCGVCTRARGVIGGRTSGKDRPHRPTVQAEGATHGKA